MANLTEFRKWLLAQERLTPFHRREAMSLYQMNGEQSARDYVEGFTDQKPKVKAFPPASGK